MVSRAIWKNISWVFQRLQIALVLRTRAILIVFEKLTRACFFQIALETILLPIHIRRSICTIEMRLAWLPQRELRFLWNVFRGCGNSYFYSECVLPEIRIWPICRSSFFQKVEDLGQTANNSVFQMLPRATINLTWRRKMSCPIASKTQQWILTIYWRK